MATRRDVRKKNERARVERSNAKRRAGGVRAQAGGCATADYKRWHLSRTADVLAEQLRQMMETGKEPPPPKYASMQETKAANRAIHDGQLKDDAFEAHLHMLPPMIVEGTAESTSFKLPGVRPRVSVTTFCTRGRLESYLHLDGEYPPFDLYVFNYDDFKSSGH